MLTVIPRVTTKKIVYIYFCVHIYAHHIYTYICVHAVHTHIYVYICEGNQNSMIEKLSANEQSKKWCKTYGKQW